MQADRFDVLGFAHICERPRKTSDCIVPRKTARKRMVAQLKGLHQQLRLLRLRSQKTRLNWRQFGVLFRR